MEDVESLDRLADKIYEAINPQDSPPLRSNIEDDTAALPADFEANRALLPDDFASPLDDLTDPLDTLTPITPDEFIKGLLSAKCLRVPRGPMTVMPTPT